MKKVLKLAVALLVLLVLLMATTEPAKLPSIVLMLPFVLLFGVVTGCIALIIAWSKGVMTFRALRTGALGAALPVLLLVLQSIGQLTVRDVLIILLLFGLMYFYLRRATNPARL